MMRIFQSILVMLTLFSITSCAQPESKAGQTGTADVLPAPEFRKRMEASENKIILDVRTAEEFAEGHLHDAINIDVNERDFSSRIEKLDKSMEVFVYCLSGGRSQEAMEIMKSAGFSNIHNMKGGTMAWTANGLPLEGGSAKADSFTRADYEKLLASSKLILIDYYAPWCAPCKKMEPDLSALAKEFEGKVLVTRINVDEASELARELNIQSIPVITTVKDGVETGRVSGLQSPEALRALVEGLLK